MKALFVAIGDELLLGQVVDTNAAFLGQVFARHGVELVAKWTVRDRENEILEALERARATCDLVVLSGGLGPTSDDLTKPLLAKYFGANLVRHRDIEDRIRNWFRARGREPGPLNLAQADLPDNCRLLENPLGTAQGMWWDRDGGIVVALPGVPYEFKHLVEQELLPRLEQSNLLQPMVHRTLMVAGLVESSIARLLTGWEQKWKPRGLMLAYLPRPGLVRLRISLYRKEPEGGLENQSKESLLQAMNLSVAEAATEIMEVLQGYVYGENELSLEEAVGAKLKIEGKMLALAESCTGGALSARVVRVPGCSAYYRGAVMAYDNRLKQDLLGVHPTVLEQEGAVSEAVVATMATEAALRLGADYAVAISGIAGPEGGSEFKPVGTVCLGIHGPEGTRTYRRSLGTGRELVIERAVMLALFLLWRVLAGMPVLDSERPPDGPSKEGSV